MAHIDRIIRDLSKAVASIPVLEDRRAAQSAVELLISTFRDYPTAVSLALEAGS